MKILFCHGEGIGNCIQATSTIKTLKEELGYVIDYWHAFSSFNIPKIIPYVDKWIVGDQIRSINTNDYCGYVTTFWSRNHVKWLHSLPLLCKIHPIKADVSEVDTYLHIARDLGVNEEELSWRGDCLYKKVSESFDVVIHNGYNRFGSAGWDIKSYPYYDRLVEALVPEYTVCSVGAPDEHIKGTVNRTGKGLLTTLGLINKAKLFVGNDSGLYHCSNALGKSNVVIFTATSVSKNYDKRFHKYSTIIARDDLECRKDCQRNNGWKKCRKRECMHIAPYRVYDVVRGLIK